MSSYWKLHKIPILISLGSVVLYVVFAYNLVREDFVKLICLFGALFFFCVKLIQFEKYNFRFLLVAGIIFRLIFLIAEPNLSQDFYRFIWDGELINQGINPYLFTPDELIQNVNFQISNSNVLHHGMGELSARHYSNYPPINQLIFALSSFLGFGSVLGSVIWMRIFVIAADIGIVYLGRKLLRHLNLNAHIIFWYFLNPLVIIELTGNLHFEGVMLFFFICAMHLISKERIWLAAPIYAASIMIKLVPILFLPLFLPFLGLKKSIGFYMLTGLCCLGFLLPFYSPSFVDNYSQTVGLWFSNFEFNAGFYNLVKVIAVNHFEEKPWEVVKDYGDLVPLVMILIALILTIFRSNRSLQSLFGSMLILLTSYYFLSTTVHPWYVIFVLLLSLFTAYRYALLWSATVILSYFAYSNPDFKENLALLFIEYFLVFGFLVYEIFKKGYHKILIPKKMIQE